MVYPVLINDIDNDNKLAVLLSVVNQSYSSNLHVPLERLHKKKILIINYEHGNDDMFLVGVRMPWRNNNRSEKTMGICLFRKLTIFERLGKKGNSWS